MGCLITKPGESRVDVGRTSAKPNSVGPPVSPIDVLLGKFRFLRILFNVFLFENSRGDQTYLYRYL